MICFDMGVHITSMFLLVQACYSVSRFILDALITAGISPVHRYNKCNSWCYLNLSWNLWLPRLSSQDLYSLILVCLPEIGCVPAEVSGICIS